MALMAMERCCHGASRCLGCWSLQGYWGMASRRGLVERSRGQTEVACTAGSIEGCTRGDRITVNWHHDAASIDGSAH